MAVLLHKLHARGYPADEVQAQAADQADRAADGLPAAAEPAALSAPAGFVAHELNGAPRCPRCVARNREAMCEQLPCLPDMRADRKWVFFTKAPQ